VTRITKTLHEDRHTFLSISRSLVLRMKNVSEMSFRKNQNTHFMFNKFSFENREVFWDNVEKCGTARQAMDGNIIRSMHIKCGITKATKTY